MITKSINSVVVEEFSRLMAEENITAEVAALLTIASRVEAFKRRLDMFVASRRVVEVDQP